MKKFQMLAFFCCFIVILPTVVFGDCKCEPEEEQVRDKDQALKYKVVALASILFSSAIGVYIPMLGKTIPALGPDKDIFFLIKAFAAGVILSTGFIHVLPDAFENLSSDKLPENPWGMFPFTGLLAMLSAIGTLLVDSFATSYYRNSQINKAGHQPQNGDDEEKNGEHAVHVHTHASHGHGHAHGSLALNNSDSELLRHRVISQVLELGIVVHSVIIGISLGASQSPKIIKPLIAALTFHQFFEGMGLGGCITQAKFKTKNVAIMALFFSLTTPIGIAIGIGISKVYDENSTTALIVEGIFNAASAGILIYMALVDLLAADHMSPKLQNNFSLRVVACVSLLLGAGCMSVLAIWA